MNHWSLPPKLNLEELSKAHVVPEKPEVSLLEGKLVYLMPLNIERDSQQLFEVSNGSAITLGEHFMESYDPDQLIWRYLLDGPFKTKEDFVNNLSSFVNAPNGLCLCVFDNATKKQVGVVNLMNNYPAHLKVELGGIWYSPIVQGKNFNMETTYLLLNYCFNLGYRRVEWKCHSFNARSRKAALKMGFKYEGTHESHMIVRGRNRDTDWFRILEKEWPDVKKKLEHSLYQ